MITAHVVCTTPDEHGTPLYRHEPPCQFLTLPRVGERIRLGDGYWLTVEDILHVARVASDEARFATERYAYELPYIQIMAR